MQGGFTSHTEKIDAHKVRERSRSFFDHFSQARLFYNSQTDWEKNHIIEALSFELGKVQTIAIRERMLRILNEIEKSLAAAVAYNLGLHIPKESTEPLNMSIPADGDPASFQPVSMESSLVASAALSMANTVKDTIQTRQIAILASDGVNAKSLLAMREALKAAGADTHIISSRQGFLSAQGDEQVAVDHSFLTTASVLYDAVYVPGGVNNVATLEAEPDAVHFLNQAFKHCKAIAADADALQVLEATYFYKKLPEGSDRETVLMEGVVIGGDTKKLADMFISAIKQHRFWEREKPRKVPA